MSTFIAPGNITETLERLTEATLKLLQIPRLNRRQRREAELRFAQLTSAAYSYHSEALLLAFQLALHVRRLDRALHIYSQMFDPASPFSGQFTHVQQGHLHLSMALYYARLHEAESYGLEHARTACALFEQAGDRRMLATAHMILGHYYSSRALYAKALAEYDAADKLYDTAQQPRQTHGEDEPNYEAWLSVKIARLALLAVQDGRAVPARHRQALRERFQFRWPPRHRRAWRLLGSVGGCKRVLREAAWL